MIGAQAGAKARTVAVVSRCCALLGLGAAALSWLSALVPFTRWSEEVQARYRDLVTDAAARLSPRLSHALSFDSGCGSGAAPAREGGILGGAEASPARTEQLRARACPGSTRDGSTGKVV